MLYVFEGIDGAGKTTIAQMVSRKTAIPYFNCFNDKKYRKFVNKGESLGVDECYADFVMIDLVRQTGMDFIMDRSYPSGWVYTQLQDSICPLYPGFDEDQAYLWETEFKKIGIIFWIRADCTMAQIRSRKGFTMGKIVEIRNLYDAYFNLFDKLTIFIFDNSINNMNEVEKIAHECSRIIKLYRGDFNDII